VCALTSPASAGRFRTEHIRIILHEVVASIRGCDGHHEMSDLVAASEPVHSDGESVAVVWPHQQRMVRTAWVETIMSKTNDTSKLGRASQVRELRDDELNAVSGGGNANLYVPEPDTGRRLQK